LRQSIPGRFPIFDDASGKKFVSDFPAHDMAVGLPATKKDAEKGKAHRVSQNGRKPRPAKFMKGSNCAPLPGRRAKKTRFEPD